MALLRFVLSVPLLLAPLPTVHAQPSPEPRMTWTFDVGQDGTADYDVDPAGSAYVVSSHGGFFVTRADAAGRLLWRYEHPAPSGYAYHSASGGANSGNPRVLADADGAYVVMALSLPAEAPYPHTSRDDLLVMRVSAEGALLWSHVLDGPGTGEAACPFNCPPGNNFREQDYLRDVAREAAGDLVVLARSGFKQPLAWTFKVTRAGEIAWSQAYDLDSSESSYGPSALAPDCDGRVHAVAAARAPFESANGSRDFLVLTYEADGRLARASRFRNPVPENVRFYSAEPSDALALCDGGGLVVAGRYDGEGETSRVLVRVGPDGGVAWHTRYARPAGHPLDRHLSAPRLAWGGDGGVYVYGSGRGAAVLARHSLASGAVEWAREYAYAQGELARTAAGLAAGPEGVYVVSEGGVQNGRLVASLRHYSPEGDLRWGVTVPDPAPTFASTFTFGDNGLRRGAGGGLFVRALHPGGRLYRFGALPAPPQAARVRLVHGAAALAGLGPVEVYLGTAAEPAATLAYPGTSSILPAAATLVLPAGAETTVRVRPVSPPPFPLPREVSFPVSLGPGCYVAVAAGIPEPLLAAFAPNPDGADRLLRAIVQEAPCAGFDAAPVGDGLAPRAKSAGGATGAVVAVHAVTDAPTLDVVVPALGVLLAQGLRFGEGAPATALPVGTHVVEVRAGAAIIASQRVTVSEGDGAVVALPLSGFLDPSRNQDGPPLRVVAVDRSGVAAPGQPVTAEGIPQTEVVFGAPYPNPSAGAVQLRIVLRAPALVRVRLLDALGRVVRVLPEAALPAGAAELALPTEGLAPGVYVVQAEAGAAQAAHRLVVAR